MQSKLNSIGKIQVLSLNETKEITGGGWKNFFSKLGEFVQGFVQGYMDSQKK